MPKIIDKIKKAIEQKHVTFSYEYFAPKTPEGVKNLLDRIERMARAEPTWIDVTWGAGGSTSQLTLDICRHAQNMVGVETMMHLTCTNLPKEQVLEGLRKAKEAGIQNILALRGDPPVGQTWKAVEGGLRNAVDLVRLIRKEYGDFFGICVAGYPEGHSEAESYEKDLQYLKEKVDAGADMIITQLFYDVENFEKWVADCRRIGITVPILPGIMPIQTFAGFTRMTTMCKTRVPQAIHNALAPIKDDDEAVKAYGVDLAVEMCKRLLEAGLVPGLHFYTLNLERSTYAILAQMGMDQGAHLRRAFPWRAVPSRKKEDVRPIYWQNRPKSYLHRTASWDEFPNGRWGDSNSPAFGDLSDYHLMTLHVDPSHAPKVLYGTPTKEEEVFAVFVKYIQGQLPCLPWSDSPLRLEASVIKSALVMLNQNGYLTISSQPRVHGAPSEDPVHGWGGHGGFVYQKAYVEFFTSSQRLHLLMSTIKKEGYRFKSLDFMAVNNAGQRYASFFGTTAVTWGTFPGREILQPTIVDSTAFFDVWRHEAFGLWQSQFIQTYEAGSPSRALFEKMHKDYFLVSIVDNNVVNGDIWALFNTLIPQHDSIKDHIDTPVADEFLAKEHSHFAPPRSNTGTPALGVPASAVADGAVPTTPPLTPPAVPNVATTAGLDVKTH